MFYAVFWESYWKDWILAWLGDSPNNLSRNDDKTFTGGQKWMKQLKSYVILEYGKKGSLLTHPVNQILTVSLSYYACKAKKKYIS